MSRNEPALQIFNTATRKVEKFRPGNPEAVKIYTCGPTVYSTPHIGNFAAYIYWDLLVRVIELDGMKVRRVLNLTDVGHLVSDADEGEDKLEKGAKREGKTPWEVAEYYIDEFKSGFRKLGLREPAEWARATDYIEAAERLVERLIENGYAYETKDGIYFDTAKFERYAEFARLDLENLKAGARVEFSQEKRNVADFAVWKFIQEGEKHAMRWKFLGKDGYPGWHLECSTIIHETLGEPIDLHAGGIDHIPVHHTNEIAQTFGAFGVELAKAWMHCNFLKIDGEKISKSLGNIITLEGIEEKGFSVFDFKAWLYQGHYRAERNFTFEDLEAARNRRLGWRNVIARRYQDCKGVVGGVRGDAGDLARGLEGADGDSGRSEGFREKFLSALNDDLNSAQAFAVVDEELEKMSLEDFRLVEEAFGLDLFGEDLTEEIAPKIREREEARARKDFASADKIRDELKERGVELLDTSEGTVWQYIK